MLLRRCPPQVLGLNRGIYALKRVRFHNKDQEVGVRELPASPEQYSTLVKLRFAAVMCAPLLSAEFAELSALLPGVPTTQAVKGFIDEITLLRQLRGKPNIIQLIDAQVSAPAATAGLCSVCPLERSSQIVAAPNIAPAWRKSDVPSLALKADGCG